MNGELLDHALPDTEAHPIPKLQRTHTYHLHRLTFTTTSQHLLQRTSGARSAGQAEAVQAATTMCNSSSPALPVISSTSAPLVRPASSSAPA